MSTTTADGTAAPMELKLGEKTYRMKPIGFAEIGEFERWAQQKYIADNERLLELANIPDDAKTNERLKALETARRLSMNASDDDAVRIMNEFSSSVEGIARLMYLSIRRLHSDVTFEEIATAMEDQANVEIAMSKFNNINGADTVAADAGKSQKKTRKRKKKSR